MEWWCWRFDQWKDKNTISMIFVGVDQPWVWKVDIEGEQVMSVQGWANFYCSLHYTLIWKISCLPCWSTRRINDHFYPMQWMLSHCSHFLLLLFIQFKAQEPSKIEDYWTRSLQECRGRKWGACAKEIWREGGWFDIANISMFAYILFLDWLIDVV